MIVLQLLNGLTFKHQSVSSTDATRVWRNGAATDVQNVGSGRSTTGPTEQLRSLAVGPFRFFASPISGAFNVYANNSTSDTASIAH
jgi:hypothetical protein